MKISKREIKEIIVQEMAQFNKQLKEGKMQTQFQIPTREQRKVDMLLRKARYKEGKDFDYGAARGPKFILAVPRKLEDKILSLLVQKGVKNIHEV